MTQLFDDRPTPRRPAIPLLVELCAGTAALSLRLERAGARPPVSRMGAKTGYADCILALAGLDPGDMAGHYLWCEPDDGVRLLLHAYRDADLAREAARIIRSWADEEPRALWERLRAEGPARCPPVDAREVARWTWSAGHCYRKGDLDSGFQGNDPAIGRPRQIAATQAQHLIGGLPATIHDDATTLDPREVARCLQIIASNELINVDSQTWRNTGQGGSTFGGSIGYGADRMLRKLEAAPTLPATIHDDATTLDPREVARLTLLGAWSYRQGQPESGAATPADCHQTSADGVANRIGSSATVPATIHDDATTAPIPDPLPEGTLVFIDPPYVGTTGYAHDLDRPAVVRLAQQWAAAGARVMISEAVPIEALVACGWHAVEVSAMRVGQKRTFSKQQREWLTTSFEPDRRAVRACELAAERAERAAAVMAGGEQRDLFDVPELGNRSRGGGWQSATALPTPSTGADGAA